MTEFIDLNHPDFAIKDDYLIPTSSEPPFCVCCLEMGTSFFDLSKCKHSDFLYSYCGFNVKYYKNLCHKCHNILKRIEAFKVKVKESAELFKSQINIFTPRQPHTSLQFTGIEISFTIGNQPISSEVHPQSTTLTNQLILDTILKTEIKIEHESDFDYEEVPLSEIKSKKSLHTKKIKKITKKRPHKLQKSTEQYEGKIKVVTLNTEELMLEREQEKEKEAYKRLPYKCEDCIVGFDHGVTLNEHFQSRHIEVKGGFVCKICKSVLKTDQSFRQHCRRHHMRYECEECARRTNTLPPLVKHYNEAHGPIATKTYVCRECEFSTTSNRKYRYHRDKHREKEQCNECGKTFVTKTSLKLHMFTIHKQSSRVYACSLCDKTYSGKSGLAAHARAHAGAHAGPAWCAPCARPFRSTASLQHHLNTHSAHVNEEDFRFICDHCEQKFLTKAALQEHIDWVHLHKTKHECSVCGKAFKNSSALKKHKDFVHEKKRPPRNKICDHCGRAFTSLCILRAHVRTHTGERPLRCARCPQTFAHPAALYTHRKLLHAGDGGTSLQTGS